MKILSWMQHKLGAKQTSCKKSTVAETSITKHKVKKQERWEWNPSGHDAGRKLQQHGLLAIGTFGNSESDGKGEGYRELVAENKSCTIQDFPEFSIEELGELKQELTEYLALNHYSKSDLQSKLGSEHVDDYPLNKSLNWPSNLDVDDRGITLSLFTSDPVSESEDPDNYNIIPIKGNYVACGHGACTGWINRKPFTLVLKNIFAGRSGFVPAPPSLREAQLLESRLDKLLRTIIHRKIYPHNSSSGKKIIQRISTAKGDPEDEMKAKECERSKWIKTDSDFIVLEM